VSGELWTPAYVGLGSNLDEPARQLDAALAGLAGLEASVCIAASGRYRSRPVGVADQPEFLNAAAVLLTRLEAPALHAALRALETRLGKVPPRVRFGPRSIDLDLLVFGAQRLETELLTVPHPRLHERAFVLYPLAELAPALWVPGRGRVAALKERVAADILLPP
jgi:2-amino-4-hydroxy-6-hydroxymethyldihydropteridine diphosphokinase